VTFSLWAPAARTVEVVTSRPVPMRHVDGGWFEAVVPDAAAGTRYKFRIDGEIEVPDPASSFQPDDVSGPSEIVDHRYPWKAQTWRGRPWHEAAILEIHIGTFTQGGTFLSAIEKLDEVVRTGFTAIELMPIADFAGRWNWGYDGVLWFAPDSAYGRPEDLKALIDAAHQRGLMVFLDVVYNHFGPEGNYLNRYAPAFFTSDVQTPWGSAIDFGISEVRAFVLQNVQHWLEHYRFDGLRLDAVHAIAKRGSPPILEDISKAAGELARASNRIIHLVLENDNNEASLLDPLTPIAAGKYRAQWDDDYHHAWHVLLTGETSGYYADYAGEPLNDIARILRAGFAYQGQPSAHRGGKPRGEPSERLPPTAFVSFLQNHDQIGNRGLGERLDALAPPERVEAALAVMLLAPMPPLMFMGEQWGETQPFPFFCDFQGDLAQAVRDGRRKEFEHAFESLPQDRIPDPISELTYSSAVIRWDFPEPSHGARRHQLVQRLLACRASEVVPHLAGLAENESEAMVVGTVLTASWRLRGGTLHLKANLGDKAGSGKFPTGRPIWNHQRPATLPPWSVFWTWES
jgi:malto-oligosyltrehalose trehalohydrolase